MRWKPVLEASRFKWRIPTGIRSSCSSLPNDKHRRRPKTPEVFASTLLASAPGEDDVAVFVDPLKAAGASTPAP